MFLKDPDARLDYRVDWSDACGPGVEIAESQWATTPLTDPELRIGEQGLSDNVAWVELQGGTPGALYRIGNHVRFSDGRTDERSLALRVEQR